VEHIVAKQHGGGDEIGNLALACHRCNLYKGPNLTGIDSVTGEVVPLFHPRRDLWNDHFVMQGSRIEGITAIGRATAHVLAMNDARRLELRAELLFRSEARSKQKDH
jgi:5-methylcytosine-specific restriction endonuclease McrA